jgi:hypothetical protein
LVAEKEKRKLDLLKKEEETRRQKIRVTWVASTERNTKFFHSYANYRRHENTIWKIRKEYGSFATSQKDLEHEVVLYFKIFLKIKRIFLLFIIWKLFKLILDSFIWKRGR